MKTILDERQTKIIINAIGAVWDVGYKDKTMLLIEAIGAISAIETVMTLAQKEKPAEAD